MRTFLIAAAILAATATIAPAQTTGSGSATQQWRDATGKTVTIPRPRNHRQCVANGKRMHYSVEETLNHCDRVFPRG